MFREQRLCNAYRRATGSVNTFDLESDGSGTAIAQGDLIELDASAGRVLAWVTTEPILGLAKEASTAAGTLIEVDVLLPGSALIGDVDSGTPASADIHTIVGDQNGVNVALNTTPDFLYIYIGSTTEVFLYPLHYAVGSNDNLDPDV